MLNVSGVAIVGSVEHWNNLSHINTSSSRCHSDGKFTNSRKKRGEKKSPLIYFISFVYLTFNNLLQDACLAFSTNSRAYERDWIHVLFFPSLYAIYIFGGNEEHSKLEHKKEWEGESDYYIALSLSTPSAKWFVFIIILFVLWHSRVLWLKQLVFNIKFFSLLFFSLMPLLFIIVIPIKLFSFFLSLLLHPINFLDMSLHGWYEYKTLKIDFCNW